MRTVEVSNETYGISGAVIVPEFLVYAFNPNYIEVKLGGSVRMLKLTVSNGTKSYSIDVHLYQGQAKCYISKMLQILFDDYISTRSQVVNIAVSLENGEDLFASEYLVLWGALELGKRYGYYHPFVYDRNFVPKQEREVIWFKNLPFRVSLFRENIDNDVYAVTDGTQKIIFKDRDSVFLESTATVGGATSEPMLHTAALAPSRPTFSGSSSLSGSTLNMGDLKEAGLKVDLAGSGIWTNSQVGNLALGDVVLGTAGSGYGGNVHIDWDEFVNSGLDMVTYQTLALNKVGIIELNPKSMFKNARKEVVFVIMNDKATKNAFDANFNIKFEELAQLAYIVRLTICEETSGVYLRWIDQYGFWQYYLFVKGESQSKNKPSSTTIDAEFEQEGVHFNANRYQTVDNTDTIKCSATNLHKEILGYVETIYKSPHIEMYVGKDYDGNELWLPVNLESGTATQASDKLLADYEITISMQQTQTQSL